MAIELGNCLLIIDEQKGRNFALKLGINIIGTLGIIIEAKIAGYLPSVKLTLKAIKQTDFRISEELERIILKKAGEKVKNNLCQFFHSW